MKKSAFILMMICSATLASAQFMGAQLGLSYIYNGVLNPTLGIHFNNFYHKQSFHYGGNLHVPFKYTNGVDKAVPRDTNLSKFTSKMNYDEKVNMMDLFLFYRYYFWGKASQASGALYFLGGVTVGLEYSKLIPGYYDTKIYVPSSSFDKLNRFFVQPSLNIGVGLEKSMSDSRLLGFQFFMYLNPGGYNTLDGAKPDHAKSLVAVRATYSLLRSKGKKSDTPK